MSDNNYVDRRDRVFLGPVDRPIEGTEQALRDYVQPEDDTKDESDK